MNKISQIIQIILLLLALLLPATASSIQRYQFESDCVYYKIVGNEAMVTCMYDNSYYDEDYYVKDYSSDYSGFVIIPETVNYNGITYPVTAIDSYTFYQCSGLTSVTIPNSVTFIGEGAFYGCDGLTSIPIANSVTSINNYVFYDCDGLTNITIPNSVTYIGSNVFCNCNGLTNVTIPNSVTRIGSEAFRNCPSLSSVNIPNSVTSIGEGAFDYTAWYDNQPNGIVYAGYVAYCYKGNMPGGTIISLKYGTVGIADFAFACDDPEGEYFPPHAQDHYALGGINMPNTLKVIGINSFEYCFGLTSINIPNSVTSIGRHSFYDCKLTSINIGNSVTSIGDYAFYRYYTEDNLNDVFSFIQDPTAVSMGSNVFPDYGAERKLHVPIGTISAYGNTKWRYYFGSIMEMDPVLTTSIELDVTECEITEGGTLQLTTTVLPENATDKTVSWTTSNENVATVDENGLVTAVAPGSAVITAMTTDGSHLSASCNVMVLQGIVLAESIQLNVTTAGLNECATLQLTATVLPEECNNKAVIWASNNPNVATVDSNGLVTTHSVGTATITAMTTDGSNLSTTCTVTLLPVGVKGDVNGDNNINISDVTKLIDYLLSGSWN